MFSAVVLAAGLSSRMGRPKMTLPWGETTVIGKVVSTLAEAGVEGIVVVTGGAREAVEAAVAALAPKLFPGRERGIGVRVVFNPRYAEDSMITSLQVGLAALYPPRSPHFRPKSFPDSITSGGRKWGDDRGALMQAVFVTLGDQPQIEAAVVRAIMDTYRATHAPLVLPSYRMRRGHPWVMDRSLWAEALAAPASVTLRDFLNAHAAQIHYLPVETPSVLADLDTPEDYAAAQP